MIKFIYLFEVKSGNFCKKIRGLFLKYYLILHGCKVGKNLRCLGWPYFRAIPYKNIEIGNNVSIGKKITFEVTKSGRLILHDFVKLSQDILINCNSFIELGAHSGAGENVSIRDSNHGIAKDQNIDYQPIISEPIIIGKDVQISLGCYISLGSIIADGAFIGAYSIVTKTTKIIEYGIYLGTPPRLIGKRI